MYPLYDDGVEQPHYQAIQPAPLATSKTFTYYTPGAVRIAEAVSAPTKNKSHTIETTLDLKGDEQGVIVACGGLNGGYTLFIADHKLHYDYNFFNAARYAIVSPECCRRESWTSSSTSLETGMFKGIGELYVNGKKVAEGAIDKTVPGTFSLSETFDVGVDNGTPVSNNYKTKDHFPFTGQIDKVVINLIPDAAK